MNISCIDMCLIIAVFCVFKMAARSFIPGTLTRLVDNFLTGGPVIFHELTTSFMYI